MRNGAMADDTTQSGLVKGLVTGLVNDTEPMTHVVIELGETNLWVSVHTPRGPVTRPHLVAGAADGQFPAALRVTASGRWFWGAHRRHSDDEVLVTNILSRVDDPVPLVVGGSRVPAAYLVAQQVATVYRAVAGGPRDQLDLVHPADLSERGRAAVERELHRRLPAGTPLAWVSRASAAVTAVPECGELAQNDVVGVLHVGGTTSEAVAWRQTASGGDLGPALVDRGNAGHALDDTLVAALRSSASQRPAGAALDVVRLREDCAQAKVVLSSETAADVDVAGMPVRLVRGEVEELTRRLLTRQLDTLAAVLALQPQSASVRLVVLVGGGAGAPYLVEAASERFDVPVLSVPRVGDALPAAALPTATPPSPAEGRPELEVDRAESLREPVPAGPTRRSWAAAGSLPARLRRRGGGFARPGVRTSATGSTTATSSTSSTSSTKLDQPIAGQARVLMPRPVHLGVAAAALVVLWAGVQGAGLAAGAGQATASSVAAASPNGPVGPGVRAADQESAQGQGGLAFTPGGATYTVPPWLAGSDPTGATLGPGGHALSMIAAGGSPSAVAPTSTTTSPSSSATTPAPGATTASGASPSSSASPAAKATTPAGASGSTPASGGGGGSTPASSAPASSAPASNAPASNPPVSNPPASNPPASNPPASNPEPTSSAPAVEPAPQSEPPAAPTSAPADTGGGGAQSQDGLAPADSTAPADTPTSP